MTPTTDTAVAVPGKNPPGGFHTSDDARARRARRYGAERRFRLYGLAAILFSMTFLGGLLATIIAEGVGAFTHHYVHLPLAIPGDIAAREGAARDQALDRLPYRTVVSEGLKKLFPFATSRAQRRMTRDLLTAASDIALHDAVRADPGGVLADGAAAVPLSDVADLYLKGAITEKTTLPTLGTASITRTNGAVRVRSTAPDFAALLQPATARRNTGAANETAPMQPLDGRLPSFVLHLNGGAVKVTAVSQGGDGIEGEILVPVSRDGAAAAGDWRLERYEVPQDERKFSDREIALIDSLDERGLITRRWNALFFTHGASREPERAGIWGAVVGSFLTMLVTLALSFPIGLAAAVYLQEFAPKNRWTALIEVNINNLAAVPSIVFGLLGVAIFLNVMELPRSAPVVGGMVLALMTLPTIIIASRAALRAVPPSIREAALGIGASRMQTVFHHVLPPAMPGIMTGTIIGMAQALGETAPLLMIGMVAFIVDIPAGFSDAATVLPVQIFMWADFPEPAFRQKTAGAIMVLLAFLILMNILAVVLRRRFERRW